MKNEQVYGRRRWPQHGSVVLRRLILERGDRCGRRGIRTRRGGRETEGKDTAGSGTVGAVHSYGSVASIV
jgi:hypothetical protein